MARSSGAPRMTLPTQLVLRATLMDDPTRPRYLAGGDHQ